MLSTRTFLLLVLSLFMITGCSSTSSTGPDGLADEVGPAVGLDQPVHIRFATFNEGTAWYAYGASIAGLVRPLLPAGSTLDVLPLAGGLANPQLLATGKADMAMSFGINMRWAREGRIVYDTKMENLRALIGGLDLYYLLVVARRDLAINSLDELKEKKLPIRLYTITVGGQGERATQMLLEAYGLSYDDLISWGGSVNHTSFDVITTAFQDGRADILVHGTPKAHPSITEMSIMSPIKFLALPDPVIQFLESEYAMELAVLPAGAFQGQAEEVRTVGWSVGLGVTTRMAEDVAYLITKTLVEQKDKLVDAHSSLQLFDPSLSPMKVGVPLHPGAERYYREAGLLGQ